VGSKDFTEYVFLHLVAKGFPELRIFKQILTFAAVLAAGMLVGTR